MSLSTSASIVMYAPRELIFDTVADLARWPALLPHYRYVRFLERDADGESGVVEMAATRDGSPVRWVSRLEVDREAMEIRFTHVRAITRGMEVVWSFTPQPGGSVFVEIVHDLRFRPRLLAPVAERIIGGFIDAVAGRTLREMKRHVECHA